MIISESKWSEERVLPLKGKSFDHSHQELEEKVTLYFKIALQSIWFSSYFSFMIKDKGPNLKHLNVPKMNGR